MDRKTELALIAKAEKGCRKSESELLASHYNTISAIARKFTSNHSIYKIEDIIQEGCLEFIRCLRSKRFDPTMGNRLITFASKGIKLAMLRCMSNGRGQVKTSNRVNEIIARMYIVEGEYHVRYGKEPTKEYVNKHISASDKMIMEARRVRNSSTIRMDKCDGSHSAPTHDFINLDRSDSALKLMFEKQKREHLNKCLSLLGERERKIVEQVVVEEQTFNTIGKHWGVSRQRADQVYREALSKLKRLMLRTPDLIELEARS